MHQSHVAIATNSTASRQHVYALTQINIGKLMHACIGLIVDRHGSMTCDSDDPSQPVFPWLGHTGTCTITETCLYTASLGSCRLRPAFSIATARFPACACAWVPGGVWGRGYFQAPPVCFEESRKCSLPAFVLQG